MRALLWGSHPAVPGGSRAGSAQGGQRGFATWALPRGVAVRGLLSRDLLCATCCHPSTKHRAPPVTRLPPELWLGTARSLPLQLCPSHSALSISPISPLELRILLRGAGISSVVSEYLAMCWAGTRCSQSVPCRYP